MDCSPPGSSVYENSLGKNIEVDCHALLQGIFPTQGSNPGLLHCRRILYPLSHQESPRTLEWVAYPFSRGSSQPRNRTRLSCIAGGFFTSWATREAQKHRSPYLLKKLFRGLFLREIQRNKRKKVKEDISCRIFTTAPSWELREMPSFMPDLQTVAFINQRKTHWDQKWYLWNNACIWTSKNSIMKYRNSKNLLTKSNSYM